MRVPAGAFVSYSIGGGAALVLFIVIIYYGIRRFRCKKMKKSYGAGIDSDANGVTTRVQTGADGSVLVQSVGESHDQEFVPNL